MIVVIIALQSRIFLAVLGYRWSGGGTNESLKALRGAGFDVLETHDENGNGEYDKGFFGIPLEDYAFSNDPTVIISVPNFVESAFSVSDAAAEISIRMTR